MNQQRLYELLDFILNDADENELSVVRAALRKREEGTRGKGAMGLDIGRLAKESAAQIQGRLGGSVEHIRGTVRRFVTDILRKNAPELTDAQIEELLAEWVPVEPAKRPEPRAAVAGGGGSLPPDALLGMVKDFVAYGSGAMTVSEETRLRADIPDWHGKYWNAFPPVIRRLVTLYLKGAMSAADFWDGVYEALGLG